MKKPNFKEILKRFTIIDMIIILCVIGAVLFAFAHIGGNEDSVQSISFDSSTLSKFEEKYLSFYREGKIVKSHVGGYNSSSGEYEELYGTILWIDASNGEHCQILLDVNGTKVIAARYRDNCIPDIYIDHITLETDGSKYENVTDIRVKPVKVSNLDEITNKIPEGVNYTFDTTVAIDTKDRQVFQELSNELFSDSKKRSVKALNDNVQKSNSYYNGSKNELSIASTILGNINGQTDFIIIRIYNSSTEDIDNIKNSFDVINVLKVT